MHGMNAVRWSKGLKKRFGIGEKTDEEIVEGEAQKEILAAFELGADFAHRGQPYRRIVITQIGHRDRSEATQAVSWSVGGARR